MNSRRDRAWHTECVTSVTEPGSPSCAGDDPRIPNDEVLYRRLSRENPDQYAVDKVTGQRWPTSAAFTPKPQEDGLSVYRRTRLEAAGLDASAVAIRPEHIIFGMEAGDIRAIKLGVRDDAWPTGIPDEKHPRNSAHALIVGWESMTRGEIKRRARELAKLPSLKLVS
jgi:hypothetical protein